MKIKLKDLTEEQYIKWGNENCEVIPCEKCIFNFVNCTCNCKNGWLNKKDFFNDKFLNQEIEIKDKPILTDKEKAYLSAVIKPFKDMVVGIKKIQSCNNGQYIQIQLKTDNLALPYFENNKYYKGMEADKEYTLEELGIYDN